MNSDGKRTILLVEGEPLVALSEARALEKNGYRVIVAPTGAQAVEDVKASPEIGLVLMDLNLGSGMDGAQAAEQILECRELPVIFMTSHTEGAVVEKVARLDSYGFIAKGSGETLLVASVRTALRLFEVRRSPESGTGSGTPGKKNAEEALRESEEIYRLIFENAADSMVVIDPETGRQLRFNRQTHEHLGYTAEEYGRLSAFEVDLLTPEQTMEFVLEPLRKTGHAHFETLHRAKSGELRDMQVNVRQIVFEGKPAALGIAHDITDRKRAEEALKRAAEEKHTLFLELQHRVKNTLVMIDSLVTLEAEQTEEPDVRTALDKLHRRIHTLAKLYSMLYSDNEIGSIQLNRYVVEVAQALASGLTGDRAPVDFRFDLDEFAVNTKYASSFGLILNELLTNALKHTVQGDRPCFVCIRLKLERDGMLLEVENDGAGLPDHFDPARTHGLGLKLVRMLALQLGGEMYFEGGRTVRFGVRADRSCLSA